jgi:hypothetical protein
MQLLNRRVFHPIRKPDDGGSALSLGQYNKQRWFCMTLCCVASNEMELCYVHDEMIIQK